MRFLELGKKLADVGRRAGSAIGSGSAGSQSADGASDAPYISGGSSGSGGMAASSTAHGAANTSNAFGLEAEAHSLAARLPDLVLEAMRITNTVTHGIHGRRRAGPGETFWQFRQFGDSDSAARVDWRRSASSDHLYVREREWEAAHTVWLWPNLSHSMQFQSHLAQTTKQDRAIVLMLAIGELLARGGERIGLLGLTRPSASRKATTRLAEALATNAADPVLAQPLPPKTGLSRFTGLIMFSDFLEPIEATRARLQHLAADGVAGHLVQVLDPAEETLPYAGRAEFQSMDGSHRWVADRAESLAKRYQEKLAAHRAGLEDIARSLGWSFLLHHTDRPASEPLLTLSMRLAGHAGDYRWTGPESMPDTRQATGQDDGPGNKPAKSDGDDHIGGDS